MKDKFYYPIESETKEVLNPIKADFRGGIYHIPRDALKDAPLPSKNGFAVIATLDENGLPNGTEYKEDNRGMTVYDTNSLQSEGVEYLGPIKDGFTKLAPSNQFDKWDGEKWITDTEAKYQYDYSLVDQARRSQYIEKVSPLMEEAHIKRNLIATKESIDEAEDIERRVLNMRAKIQLENPWPIKPQ